MGIGERIRTLRKGNGLTLNRLSKLAKVSKAYLSQLENEHFSNPSSEVLLKICGTLGVSVETLLGSGTFKNEYGRGNHVSLHLRALAKEENLNGDNLEMLSQISYNGKQPTSIDGWRVVLDAIKQSVKME
jgi:transcriptional regulator with XRE-family HTH domain